MARIVIQIADAHIQRVLAAYRGLIPVPIPDPPDPNAVPPALTIADLEAYLRRQIVDTTRTYERQQALNAVPQPADIP